MPDPLHNQVATAVADLIRARLLAGEEAHVPGLGTFRLHHEPSRIDEHPDGTLTIAPPREVIVLDPEF